MNLKITPKLSKADLERALDGPWSRRASLQLDAAVLRDEARQP
jgi:hypothetical protein